jgi:hypothetical protein
VPGFWAKRARNAVSCRTRAAKADSVSVSTWIGAGRITSAPHEVTAAGAAANSPTMSFGSVRKRVAMTSTSGP